jgi:hypothetical protein
VTVFTAVNTYSLSWRVLQLLCSDITMFEPSHTTAFRRTKRRGLFLSCGSRFAYLRVHCWCLVWGGGERGRRVGRRASLDQYSTHIASGGGWGIASQAKGERWRPREDHTEASKGNLSFLFYIYSPFFVLVKGSFLPLHETPAQCNSIFPKCFMVKLTL